MRLRGRKEPLMADEPETPKTHPTSNAVKDPRDWTTGDEPATKADASIKIDELQEKTGRGK